MDTQDFYSLTRYVSWNNVLHFFFFHISTYPHIYNSNEQNLQPYLQWIEYINIMLYAYHLVLHTVFTSSGEFVCRDDGVSAYAACVEAKGVITAEEALLVCNHIKNIDFK